MSESFRSILHVHNVAGVSSNLALFQRKLGFKAKVITRNPHPLGYEEDYYPKWKMLLALRFFISFDIIHYHVNTWLRQRRFRHFDYVLSKRLHKKIILLFHGEDLRAHAMQKELKDIIDELKIILVATPDLLAFVPSEKSVWLPFPINLDMWHPKSRTDKEHVPVIGYYNPPHDEREVYGVKYVEKAIKNLQRKGFNFETKPIYWQPHRTMPDYYSSLDVYVDRLGMGWYGVGACEAMASELTVMSYIREDLRHLLPKKEPLLISSKMNFEENLEMILGDESLRRQLGQQGRKYVLDRHDGLEVAKNLVSMYRQL